LRHVEKDAIFYQIEFEKLQDQADYANKVEPLTYVGKLILSFFAAIGSLNVITILVMDLITAWTGDDDTKYNYLENLNIWVMSIYSAKDLNLIAICNWTFVGVAYFMLYTASQGNRVFGERFAWITYEPIKPNET
jgi:hypothetical protein